MLTFRQFVAQSKAHDNPRGDLLRDLKADNRLPEIASGHHLVGYLYRRGASLDARDAARRFWLEYARYQRSVRA